MSFVERIFLMCPLLGVSFIVSEGPLLEVPQYSTDNMHFLSIILSLSVYDNLN